MYGDMPNLLALSSTVMLRPGQELEEGLRSITGNSQDRGLRHWIGRWRW
jgi:hypothetical protein